MGYAAGSPCKTGSTENGGKPGAGSSAVRREMKGCMIKNGKNGLVDNAGRNTRYAIDVFTMRYKKCLSKRDDGEKLLNNLRKQV